MKRIAIISPSELPIPAVKGGAVETGINQIINENEKEHKVDIDIFSFYNENAEKESKNYKYTKFHYYKNKKINILIRNFLKGINKIFRVLNIKIKYNIRPYYTGFIGKILSKEKYDAILIKNMESYVLPLKKYTKNPIFLQLHNDFLNNQIPNCERIVKICKNIITNSYYIKTRVLTISNTKNEDVLVNLNCLDEGSFTIPNKTEIEKVCLEYGIDNNKKNIIFTGRLVREKGICELLKAVNLIPKDIDWRLLIVGSKWFGKNTKDKFLSELYELSKDISDRIKFLGFVPHKKMNILNYISTVAVVPSIWEEPAGRVVLEAQAVGTPVIVSDAGGIKEYVSSNSAIVVNRGDNFVNELSLKIEEVMKNEKLYRKMRNYALENSKKFNSSRYYFEILEQLGVINEKKAK